MPDSADAQLPLKKRARRRLVGAVAFAGLAAIVLPMVMDEEPKQLSDDVQISIPGQDQVPFNPGLKPGGGEKSTGKDVEKDTAPAPSAVAIPTEKPAAKVADAPAVEKPAAKKPADPAPAPKAAERPVEKAAEKPAVKAPEKEKEKESADKAGRQSEAQRAAAILGDKLPANASPSAANGQFLVLIGAFSNQDNVKQLQHKLGELGIRVITEPLDSPTGKKTRVRAGPFPSRDAAEKAAAKMKRIGVNGVVAAKP